jgi:hypothetical protein
MIRILLVQICLLLTAGAMAQNDPYPKHTIDSVKKERLKDSIFNRAMATGDAIPARDIEISGQQATDHTMRLTIRPFSFRSKKALAEAFIMLKTARDKSIRLSSALPDGEAVFSLDSQDFPVRVVARYFNSQDIPVTLTEPKNYQVNLFFEPLKNDGNKSTFGQ